MADISKCTDKNCPKKNSCYRFNAPVNEPYQYYDKFKYDDGCEFYWAENHAPKKQIL